MKLALILSAAICIAPIHRAMACGYDGQINNPFTLAYPGSISVSLGTQQAIEAGKLQALHELSGSDGLARVTQWLDQLRARLQTAKMESNFSVYLIDSNLWTRYDVIGGNVLMQSHISPKENEVVLLASEATLAAMLSGKLSVVDAEQLKLIRWSGNNAMMHKATLQNALNDMVVF